MTRDDQQTLPPPATIAAQFVFWLESRGATAHLHADDTWWLDLNRIPDMTHGEAEAIADAAFELREEIRALLVARRPVH